MNSNFLMSLYILLSPPIPITSHCSTAICRAASFQLGTGLFAFKSRRAVSCPSCIAMLAKIPNPAGMSKGS